MFDTQHIIELILMTLQIVILVGLFKIYYNNYKKVKINFALGLLLFASILIIGNVFASISIFIPSEKFLSVMENLLELAGLIVLYYIARKY